MTCVSSDLVQAFHRDGAVLIKGALDPAEISIVKAAFEYHFENLAPWSLQVENTDEKRFFADLLNPGMWETQAYKRLWNETKLLDVAGQFFTAPDIWLLYEQIFFKESYGEKPVESTAWHQDTGIDPVEGRDLLRFWMSLEPLEKGYALEFVRGSHLGPVYDARDNPTPDIEADRGRWDILTWAMEPGDVVAFHPGVLHGGAPTKPNGVRRTLTMLLFGRDSRYAPRSRTPVGGEKNAAGQALQEIMYGMFQGLAPGDPAWRSRAPRLR